MTRIEFTEFRDFDISFNSHPLTNDLILVKGDRSIIQSIISLLSTKRGERLIDKEVGTDLGSLLFEPLNENSARDIRNEISRTITENEGRVRALEVEVTPVEEHKGYRVYLYFYTKEPDINDPEEKTALDFFLPHQD